MNAPRQWSKQQEAIFGWFKTGKGNLVVEALAGTGKTTTILEAVNHAPELRILVAAFNKRIATELTEKLATSEGDASWKADAKTLHALGFESLRSAWRGIKVDDKRGLKIAEEVAPQRFKRQRDLVSSAARLATLMKETMPFAKGPGDLEGLVIAFNLMDPACPPEALSEWAFNCVKRAEQQDGTIDFSDMIYLPVKLGFAKPTYEAGVIDEAQDMNATQLELSLMSVKKGGRICVVGDSHQAIYGFRGADSAALINMKSRLKAKVLGLTTTYRCPQAVVKEAQSVVPQFTAHESAPKGRVAHASDGFLYSDAIAGDFILGRTNAALMTTCLTFIREGKRARIEGREIGAGLAKLVKKLGGGTIDGFLTSLDQYTSQQLERAEKADDEKRKQQISDQHECLAVLANECASLDELVGKLFHLFDDSDGRPMIVCSTVHKAKGLEADRVFILCDSFRVKGNKATATELSIKRDNDMEESSEEHNIWYVAVTRAKKELIFISKSEEERAESNQDSER